MPFRALLVSLAALLALALVVVSAEGQDGDEPVTFTVGDPQGIDSMNPLVGVTVAAYEAWNIQYATLTDKAAEDFEPIPGLAESWEGSEDGRTWTYKLRPGLKWSDGEPLTAEDVVYTINRSRDEEWINHFSTVENLKARAPDERTVVIESSVPDPKLPTMDVYILPKHVWSKLDAKEVDKYDATDGVGSGPFVLERFEKGQFARFRANPNYWQGQPAIDRVVLRKFNNGDAMVAALKRGEIDAAQDVPGSAFQQLQRDPEIETVEGYQGAMNEIAINGGDGLAKPHPALLDVEVRKAIGHAIDKQTLIDRTLAGAGTPIDTLSVSPDPRWTPEIPEDQRLTFDIDEANRILDEAGYEDTDGNGVREMPGGGQELRFRYAVRSDSTTSAPTAEFFKGWMEQIGIAITQKTYDDSRLTEVIGKGEYDIFAWGWVPFVDPDPMLSYFTCDQVASDPEDPTNYYNDANYCDPEYDKLYREQKVELDEERRVEIVHEMLTRFHESAVYHVLYSYPDQQAYRKGRFEGWTRQPAETGPVLYSNSSPTYARLQLASASGGGGGGGDDDGGGNGLLIAGVIVGVGLVGGGALMAMRRRSADERE